MHLSFKFTNYFSLFTEIANTNQNLDKLQGFVKTEITKTNKNLNGLKGHLITEIANTNRDLVDLSDRLEPFLGIKMDANRCKNIV